MNDGKTFRYQKRHAHMGHRMFTHSDKPRIVSSLKTPVVRVAKIYEGDVVRPS